jgi:hypothetical protein
MQHTQFRDIVPPFDSGIDLSKDGVDYINIDAKAKTLLGRKLASFSNAHFKHPYYGLFRSIVGYQNWLVTGKKVDALRHLYGAPALHVAKQHPRIPIEGRHILVEDLQVGHWLKVITNQNIKKELARSHLPFESFYLYGPMNMACSDTNRDITIATMAEIRRCLQHELVPDFYTKAMIRYQKDVTEGLPPSDV